MENRIGDILTRSKKFNLRNAVLLRDNNKCRWCEATDNLQVHHLNHENSNVDQLITLCKICHTRLHLIERTHIDGDLSYIWCGACKEKGEFVSQFLIRKTSNNNEIWVCPNCGRGMKEDRNADIIDKWINPFHSEMMTLYPPTAMEIWG